MIKAWAIENQSHQHLDILECWILDIECVGGVIKDIFTCIVWYLNKYILSFSLFALTSFRFLVDNMYSKLFFSCMIYIRINLAIWIFRDFLLYHELVVWRDVLKGALAHDHIRVSKNIKSTMFQWVKSYRIYDKLKLEKIELWLIDAFI